MSSERGTVLIEMIVLGFATLLVVLPTLTTIARIVDMNAVVAAEARDAANWVARHGNQRIVERDGVRVEVSVETGFIRATARATVTLVALGGAKIDREVVASFEAPVSPYRSDR